MIRKKTWDMAKLTEKKCLPCEGGVPKLGPEEIKPYLAQLKTPWEVVDDIKISRDFHFKTYLDGIRFVDEVAALAEEEDHHPVMHVYFSKVGVEIWTHAILGLSENDFILAAKIEQLLADPEEPFILE